MNDRMMLRCRSRMFMPAVAGAIRCVQAYQPPIRGSASTLGFKKYFSFSKTRPPVVCNLGDGPSTLVIYWYSRGAKAGRCHNFFTRVPEVRDRSSWPVAAERKLVSPAAHGSLFAFNFSPPPKPLPQKKN